MIVLLGIPSEPPVAMVADALERADAAFVLIDQRDALEHDLELAVEGGRPVGGVSLPGRSLPIDSITAIYVRLTDHRVLPEREGLAPDDPAAAHIDRLHERWLRLLDVAPALVVNRLAAMVSNSSKPYQTELIRRLGLDTPETIVTTDPAAARRFIEAADGDVIYKSVSGVRSIVRRVAPSDLDRLDLVAGCPTQFQRFVPGDDVRVHVIGDEVVATLVRSDADDYRYARLESAEAALEPVELDDRLADRCRAVARGLGLCFAGIDLRVDGDRAVCFEVNPSPAYSYYEANTGQPISEALARLLGGGAPLAA